MDQRDLVGIMAAILVPLNLHAHLLPRTHGIADPLTSFGRRGTERSAELRRLGIEFVGLSRFSRHSLANADPDLPRAVAK